MPGEEGYPAYLGSRLAEFYERAGMVQCLGSDKRIGTLTAIGAVSPPGGDLSEPVTQATLRIVKVFWGLDANLAYRRHFPAIDWLTSYSLYEDKTSVWFDENVNEDWSALRAKTIALLSEEAELNEIVRLVGYDALSEKDQLTLEVSRSVREDYLQQNSFHELDSYASLQKQYQMLALVTHFGNEARRAIDGGVYLKKVLALPVREKITRAKYMSEQQLKEMEEIRAEITNAIDELISFEQNSLERGDHVA
jgi:V/A-type H+-transporting ATPase subunit A